MDASVELARPGSEMSAKEKGALLLEYVRGGVAVAGLDFAGARLEGVDLRGAGLVGVGLREARLRGAVLRGSDLRDADLRGADLREGMLTDADLRGADLGEARLHSTELGGVVIDRLTVTRSGWPREMPEWMLYNLGLVVDGRAAVVLPMGSGRSARRADEVEAMRRGLVRALRAWAGGEGSLAVELEALDRAWHRLRAGGGADELEAVLRAAGLVEAAAGTVIEGVEEIRAAARRWQGMEALPWEPVGEPAAGF